MHEEDTFPFPSLASRNGIVVIDGFGIDVRVMRGHLIISGGIMRERRHARFSRATAGFERLVVLAHSGAITLDALRWLREVGASLLVFDSRLGTIAVGESATPKTNLMRAQAVSPLTNAGLAIAKYLIGEKIAGQRSAIRFFGERLTISAADAELARLGEMLPLLDSTERVMQTEALASRAYWAAWRFARLSFRRSDLATMPAHWAQYTGRFSLVGGTSRKATDPLNATLNYAYALLEAEARIATVALGMNPRLGVLHADLPGRDSLVFDVMEPARATVDVAVLRFLSTRRLSRLDLAETPDGQCRLLAPLTHELACTVLPVAKQAVFPHAAHVAQVFSSVDAQLRPQTTPTSTLRGVFVPALFPVKRAIAKRTVRRPRKIRVPLTDAELAWYHETLVPRLASCPLRAIAAVSGVSVSAASRIRRGTLAPRAAWDALADLVSINSI